MDTQEEINYGQRRINYELSQVDLKLIEALKAVVETLKAVKAAPQSSPASKQIDFNRVDAAIKSASEISSKVADIKPPGCEGPYPD